MSRPRAPGLSGREARARERGSEWGRRIVVAEQDEPARRALARELARAGMEVVACESAAAALERVRELEPPVLVAACHLAGESGLELLVRVKEELPRVQRVLVTGEADLDLLLKAWSEAGLAQVVMKPYEAVTLRAAIRAALEQHRLVEENARLRDLVEEQRARLDELNADTRAAIRRRERKQSASKAIWERAFDVMADPIAVLDAEGRVRRANPAYAQRARRDLAGLVGRPCHDVLFSRSSPCSGCPLGEGGAREGCRGEVRGRQRGEVLEVSLHPISEAPTPAELTTASEPSPAFVCHYRDVTEERSLQSGAARTERLLAVGQLAAGVAHELNNPLGGVLALTQVLLRDGAAAGEDLDILRDIEDAALRCKRIIQALLTFARGPVDDRVVPVDVGRAVDDALVVARPALRAAQVREEVVVEPDLPEVRGSPALLTQALVSLVRNACEALERAPDPTLGCVTVRALAEPDAVWIEVADNGPGIREEDRARLFTPFATGRDTVEGAGFGLAMVHRIVESFGGRIEVLSPPDSGATFRMVLPASSPGPEE